MDVNEEFWNCDLEDLKRGYVEKQELYLCVLCGHTVEKGLIYPEQELLLEAEKYMKYHITKEHTSVFHHLISYNKKLTGLTDTQSQMLRYFYEGKSDEEIKTEMGAGSTSTIRNHRFVLKEKERQARMAVTLFDLLKEKDHHAPSVLVPHQTATMVDERYNVTKEESHKMLKKYFDEETNKLKYFPAKEKQKLVVLREIATLFTPKQQYSEKEVNEIIKRIYDDFVTLRRYLIAYGFLDRKKDGSSYWVKSTS
ncbi:hypothetical protein A374_02474 [Fictibacillus macauensis ZFHKF-1]|uniref:DUF2087 domain-containing protein n=1 Tax=Fictibacillus macauensis ZFHKF-1 TaxID=1196324 RepID=I8AM97_9BACL|nr:DUF2087 domain-containing protein [Fictibacillus macauensis]EIT87082.1 hypothetical protein A374_02474 [Fictibacillus macauensis ZFHKF-1]